MNVRMGGGSLRRLWLVALAALVASGCSEWPRAGNLGDAPNYVAGDEVVTATVVYVDEAESEDFPDLVTELATTQVIDAFPIGRRFTGMLAASGWSDTLENTDTDTPDCPQFGPIAPGYYDGDPDVPVILDIAVESYVCVRGRLDTTEDVGWDLVLMNIDGACPVPVADGEGITYGSNLSRADVVWGANVPAGRYALLLGAYFPGSADFATTYTAAVSAWAPFSGSPAQCPLLEVTP
jgi:hypothetical protein